MSLFSLILSIVYREDTEGCSRSSLITFWLWLLVRGVVSNMLMWYRSELSVIYPTVMRHVVGLINVSWYGLMFAMSDLLICIACYDLLYYLMVLLRKCKSIYCPVR